MAVNKFKIIGLSLTLLLTVSFYGCSNEKSASTKATKDVQLGEPGLEAGYKTSGSVKKAPDVNSGKVLPSAQFELRSSHKTAEAIQWYSFEEGIKKAKLEKKYIFVNFYTDWCTYCKKLDAETYTNEKVFNFINDKFIPVKVNAESQTKLTFNGKKITEQELAQQFEVSSYPTMFFLSGEKEAIGQVPGFIDAEQLYTLARYVASDSYKNKTLEQYKNAQKI